jgi:hypothetical protein
MTYYVQQKVKPGPCRTYKVPRSECPKGKPKEKLTCMDDTSVKNYMSTLQWLTTFALGFKDMASNKDIPNPFEDRLTRYRFFLQRCGFSIQKINALVGRFAGKFKYGDISYRICRKVRL